jgi:hypothetical protein
VAGETSADAYADSPRSTMRVCGAIFGGWQVTDHPRRGVQSRHQANAPAAGERSGAGIKEVSLDARGTLLTVAEAARVLREAVKDKSYRAFPLGQEAGH